MPYQFDIYQSNDLQSLNHQVERSIAFSTPSTSASAKVASSIQDGQVIGIVFYQIDSHSTAEPVRPFSSREFTGTQIQEVAAEVEIFLNTLPPESAYWAKTTMKELPNKEITITIFYP